MTYAFNFSHLSDKAIWRIRLPSKQREPEAQQQGNRTDHLDFSVRYTDTRIDGGGANDASSTLIPTSG